MVRDLKDKVTWQRGRGKKESSRGNTQHTTALSQGRGEPRELKHKVQFGWSSERALNGWLHCEGSGETLEGSRLPCGYGGPQVHCTQATVGESGLV